MTTLIDILRKINYDPADKTCMELLDDPVVIAALDVEMQTSGGIWMTEAIPCPFHGTDDRDCPCAAESSDYGLGLTCEFCNGIGSTGKLICNACGGEG